MGSLVMTGAGVDFDRTIGNPEYETVHGIDSDTPPPRKVSFERFGFTDAAIPVAVDTLKKGIDTFCHLYILLKNYLELPPRPIVPDFIHAAVPLRWHEALRFRECGVTCTTAVLALRFSPSSASARSRSISSSLW